MSLAVVHSRALVGLTAHPVSVEVHLANGLPSFTLVGLADTEVKEARERVRSALQNSGLEFPHSKRITVNLAPADLPKDSGRYDLPIAIGILAASGQLPVQGLEGYEFAGELSLSGALRPVRGSLAASMDLHQRGQQVRQVLPPGSAEEAALVPDAEVYRAAHLLDVVQHLAPASTHQNAADNNDGQQGIASQWQRVPPQAPMADEAAADMRDVKGQAASKRALEIAACGGHNVLMLGSPGAGKSMLAQRFASLLPPLSVGQALENAALHSLVGRFDARHWGQRSTLAPHHTASAVALVGGGSPPRPGAISLAHHGVLFLDEFPEFARAALEALREPLETGHITIARAAQQATFPAQFQLIAAMNPCPCGYRGSRLRACRCSPEQVARYQGRISGPLLDRIDMQIEITPLAPDALLQAAPGEPSASIRERVAAARALALARQGVLNQQLQGQALDEHSHADTAALQLLQSAATQLGWSARGIHRTLRLARSIADLAASPSISSAHVAEAVQYRRALLGPARG